MKHVQRSKKQISLLAIASALIVLAFAPGCHKEPDTDALTGPEPTPHLPQQAYSYPNGSTNLATLGRVLFYDKHLSLSNTVSCGSCHKQQYAFGDNTAFSRGLFNGTTKRNSTALISDGFFFSTQRHRFWDGRAGGTDTAVFMPVMNGLEMHMFDLNLLPPKLAKLSYYPQLFANAFGGDSAVTVQGIRAALTEFVNNMISNRSPYDQQTMTALAQEGENLFEGKARCYSCHNGNNFNGYQTAYANIGLEVNYADGGRGNITQQPADYGRFMVPSLRNLEYSAPYMHDGRYNTLREVIDHYDHGIQDSRYLSWVFRDLPQSFIDSATVEPVGDLSQYPVSQLGLSEHEKQALEAFLKSLSDPLYINDVRYSDPFK